MKVKPIISVAVLLAVLASTAVPVSAKQAYNAEEVEAGSRIAAENGMALQSDAEALALNVLCNANYGTLPEIECNANDTISSINGMIYDQSIDNKKDATAALRQIAVLLGVKDFNRELVFVDRQESEYNETYTFQQFYRGVKVERGFVSLIVAKATKQATYLQSTFAEDLSLDVNPAISSDMARTLIRKYCNAGALDAPELVIRQTNAGIDLLAWTAQTGNPEAEGAYIDAQTGDLIETISAQNLVDSYTYNSSTKNRISGEKNFTIKVDYINNNLYRLHDTTRNIWVMNDGAETGDDLQNYWNRMGESYLRQYPLSFEQDATGKSWIRSNTVSVTAKSQFGLAENEIAVGTMRQVEKAYDFYNSNFSWKGTDNQGAALIVNAGCYYGSQASPYGNFIAFNVPRNPYVSQIFDASAYDCVVHEYTHRVTGNKVRWNFSRQYGEAGCLNEGYSDIMGEYAETTPDWLIGAALGTPIRNAKLSPASGIYNGQYYKYTNWNEMNNVECHAGSTILSHAAYLMSRYGVPDACAKKIWYTSMDYLPKGSDAATFERCRAAVLIAANQVLNSMYPNSAETRKKYTAYTMMAFNAVNLKERYRKMGDVNNDGKIDDADITKINLFVRGRTTLDATSMAIADVDYDGRVTMADSEAIFRATLNGTQNAL